MGEDLSWAKLLWDLRQASRADGKRRRALLLAASLGARALCEGRASVHQLRRQVHDSKARLDEKQLELQRLYEYLRACTDVAAMGMQMHSNSVAPPHPLASVLQQLLQD